MNMIYWLAVVKICVFALFAFYLKYKKNDFVVVVVFSAFVFEITSLILVFMTKLNLIGISISKYFFSNRVVNSLGEHNHLIFYLYSICLFALFVFYISGNIQKFKPKHYILCLASFALVVLFVFVLRINGIGCWQEVKRLFG